MIVTITLTTEHYKPAAVKAGRTALLKSRGYDVLSIWSDRAEVVIHMICLSGRPTSSPSVLLRRIRKILGPAIAVRVEGVRKVPAFPRPLPWLPKPDIAQAA